LPIYEKNFEEHTYIFKYEGIIRSVILNYKFHDRAYIYRTFVNFLLKNEKMVEKIKTYDTLIAIPLSNKRYKERGYNQSLLISNKISKVTGVEQEYKNLIKIKNIVEQSKLGKEERVQNIKGVYKLRNPNELKDKKILLIDDIFTTGSTVNEASKIIKMAEPKKIGVLTIAKG
jgi:ComF family protein